MNTKEEIIEKIEEPMGDDEIKKYLPDVRIMTNKDLNKYNDIDDIFDKKKFVDMIVLLFLDSPNTGHWVLLSKYGNFIEFFDSYGNSPDVVFNFVPKEIRKQIGTEKNKLGELLKKSKYNIIYNPVKYQAENNEKFDVNTCGRHICNRAIHLKGKGYILPEYYEMMKHAKDHFKEPYDIIVSKLINM